MLIIVAVPSLEVDVLKGEWSHAIAAEDGTARLLSVMQYDSAYQFGDIVRYATHDEVADRYQALDIVKPGGYVLHRVFGKDATPEQAMKLTDAMREQHLHLEAWSLTMRKTGEPRETKPLRAGLALKPDMDALEARLCLRRGAELAGLGDLWCPTLSAAAGDMLSHRRDLNGLRSIGLAA